MHHLEDGTSAGFVPTNEHIIVSIEMTIYFMGTLGNCTWQWEIPELNGGFWWKFPLPRCQAAVEEGDWDKIQVASGPSGLDFSVCLGTVNIS